MTPPDLTIHWLSVRVRLLCLLVLFVGSLLPPYVPKAALAPQELTTAVPQFLLVEEGFIMKSSSLTKQSARRAYAEGIVHTVKEGESLEKLSNRYGISVQTIQWVNKLSEDKSIQPGDELLILPVDGVLHTVARSQSLTQIAEIYGVDADAVTRQNKLKGGFLVAGQELIIPGGKPIVGKPTAIAMVEPKTGKAPSDAGPKPAEGPKRPAVKSFTSEPTAGVLQKPCSDACFVTQYYRVGHYALDLQERGAGPIYAAEAGTIVRADYGWDGGYGNVIEVDHGNELVTLYAHCKELYVKEGDTVERGQLIAWMGNTGLVYGSTGIHVHFEVRLKGTKKNPLLYIQE